MNTWFEQFSFYTSLFHRLHPTLPRYLPIHLPRYFCNTTFLPSNPPRAHRKRPIHPLHPNPIPVRPCRLKPLTRRTQRPNAQPQRRSPSAHLAKRSNTKSCIFREGGGHSSKLSLAGALLACTIHAWDGGMTIVCVLSIQSDSL